MNHPIPMTLAIFRAKLDAAERQLRRVSRANAWAFSQCASLHEWKAKHQKGARQLLELAQQQVTYCKALLTAESGFTNEVAFWAGT